MAMRKRKRLRQSDFSSPRRLLENQAAVQSLIDLNECAEAQALKEFDHILVLHANATVRTRLADRLVVGVPWM
jgi:hypothetical protein